MSATVAAERRSIDPRWLQLLVIWAVLLTVPFWLPMFGGYTALRRPVKLVFHQEFDRITDAIAAERQIKNWSRAKKEALMQGDFGALRVLASSKD